MKQYLLIITVGALASVALLNPGNTGQIVKAFAGGINNYVVALQGRGSQTNG